MTYTRSVYPAFYSSLSGIAWIHALPVQFPKWRTTKSSAGIHQPLPCYSSRRTGM